MLSKEQILAADDMKSVVVTVKEWGGEVRVRSMSAGDRDAFEMETFKNREAGVMVNMRARLVAFTLVDESGALLFTPDEIEALGKKSAAAMQRVYVAASKLNAFTDDDVAELEKNFAPGQSADSISA